MHAAPLNKNPLHRPLFKAATIDSGKVSLSNSSNLSWRVLSLSGKLGEPVGKDSSFAKSDSKQILMGSANAEGVKNIRNNKKKAASKISSVKAGLYKLLFIT